MVTLLIAVMLLGQPADPVTVTGVVADPAGKPVPDVEVVLASRRIPEGTVPTLARTTTDARGEFRLEVPRQRLQVIGRPVWVVWAYRPGRTIAMQRAELTGDRASTPVRLTLAEPFKRSVTIHDAEGRPLAGVRLAPVLFAVGGRAQFLTPDEWLERLSVATGPDGVAVLSSIPEKADPQRLRVVAPGLVPHEFPLPDRPGSDRFELKLGHAAQLAGSLADASGRPAANVVVEVGVLNLYYNPSNPAEEPKPSGPPRPIRFDSGPIRTGADGTFVTPPQLMTGWSYQITVRPEDDPPVSSGPLMASTERTTVPPLRLQHPQRRKLAGFVRDRQGRPVAGARVFLPSGEPATTTDASGRFLIEGLLPEKTYLLVQAEGFRLQGWPGVPAVVPREQTLTLVRTTERADRTMALLSPAISREESLTLARRVLEPYLQAVLEKGDEQARWYAIQLSSRVDPSRALEVLEKQHFQVAGLDSSLRYRIAGELLPTDPVEAESIVAAIADPGDRALGYTWLAEALPDAERDRKRGLLERATIQVRAPRDAGPGADPRRRLTELARVAGGWLDLGEAQQARPLIHEGLEIVAALPPPRRNALDFLPVAARLETDRVLSLIGDLDSARRRRCHVAIAEALAGEHPAEAERVFRLIDDPSRAPFGERKNEVILQLCRPMAKADPDRARRLIAGLTQPREQACAWALVALGLVDKGDRPAARAALDEAIRLIDRLNGPLDPAERVSRLVNVAVNPAASILPIVERLAPERLDDVFWKAVALTPKGDFVFAPTFLARYDRQVADVLLMWASEFLARVPIGQIGFMPTIVRARAAVDPRGAVAMVEALPPAGQDARDRANRVIEQARESLITCLVEPIDEIWKDVWRSSGIPIDRPRYP